jgi:hypothetical protein
MSAAMVVLSGADGRPNPNQSSRWTYGIRTCCSSRCSTIICPGGRLEFPQGTEKGLCGG